jgi:hypothetical protein
MPLFIEERPSDSPYVSQIWRSRSEQIDSFISIASNRWDLVVWKQYGKTYLAIQGPETQASITPVPRDAEFFGILFNPGTFMPHLPADQLVNNNTVLPEANSRSFWLGGSSWEVPTYENADAFVNRLVRSEMLVREKVVDDVLRGHSLDLSLRSIQRRFLRSTGLTHNTIQQIARARQATLLLQQGLPIIDVAYGLGYFDQSHLNRALKYFIGQTPSQLMDKTRTHQLSFLSKTEVAMLAYDEPVAGNNNRWSIA